MTRPKRPPPASERPRARRPGRPRSAAAHEAIRRAAITLFIEQGPEAMSIEAVAANAGVGKAAIYRRWPSKEELVIDAVIEVFAEASSPDTGNVRDDLVQSTKDLQALMASSPTGDVFPRMAAEVARRTPLGRLYGARVIGPRRTLFEEALRRGSARGTGAGRRCRARGRPSSGDAAPAEAHRAIEAIRACLCRSSGGSAPRGTPIPETVGAYARDRRDRGDRSRLQWTGGSESAPSPGTDRRRLRERVGCRGHLAVPERQRALGRVRFIAHECLT